MIKLSCGLILIFLFCQSLAVNPGVEIRINKAGMNFAAQKAINILGSKLKYTTIPNQSGSGWKVFNIKTTYYKNPQASISTHPKHGMAFTLSKGVISMEANWYYKYWFFKGSGKVIASSSNIYLKQVILVKNNGGKPKFFAGSCSTNLGDFSIRTSGRISWLYNIVLRLFRNKIKNLLESEICNSLKNVINLNANNEMNSFNLKQKFDENFILDYSLISNPSFDYNFIETNHKGLFLGDPQKNIFLPQMSPFYIKMLNIAINEELFNSAGRIINKRNLFYYSISKNLKDLGKIDLVVKGISSPKVSITTSGVKIGIDLQGTVSINSNNAITLNSRTEGRVYIWVKEEKIVGKVVNFNTTVNLVNPLGSVNNVELNELVNSVEPEVVKKVNSKLSEGLILPKIKNVKFVSPSISFRNGYLIVSTNCS